MEIIDMTRKNMSKEELDKIKEISILEKTCLLINEKRQSDWIESLILISRGKLYEERGKNFEAPHLRRFPFESHVLPVKVVVKNDRKRDFSTLMRFHFKTFGVRIVDDFNEFALSRFSCQCFLTGYRNNICFEFVRRFPDSLFNIESVHTEKGSTLGLLDFEYFLQFKPSESLIVVGEIVQERNKIGYELKYDRIIQSGLYDKVPWSLRSIPNNLFHSTLRMFGLYFSDPKKFSKESTLHLQKLERLLTGNKNMKPYKILPYNSTISVSDGRVLCSRVMPNFSLHDLNTRIIELEGLSPSQIRGYKNIGELNTTSFLDFFSMIVSQALVDEDYKKAFEIVARSCSYSYYHRTRKSVRPRLISTYYSSILSFLSRVVEYERKPSKLKEVYYKSEYIQGIIDIVNVKKKDCTDKSILEDENETRFNSLVFTEKDELSKKNIQSYVIPFLLEMSFIHLLRHSLDEKETERAFEIVYQIMILKNVDTTHRFGGGFDFIVQNPRQRILEFQSTNPLCVEAIDERRVYNILIHHILRKRFDGFVRYVRKRMVIKEQEKNESPSQKTIIITSSESFHVFGTFLFNRGEFDLSLKYFRLATKENRMNLSSSVSIFHLLMEQGKYEEALMEGKWIMALTDKIILKKTGASSTIINFKSLSSYILSKSEDEEGIDDFTFFRIPCVFQEDIWVIVGKKEDTNKNRDDYNIIKNEDHNHNNYSGDRRFELLLWRFLEERKIDVHDSSRKKKEDFSKEEKMVIPVLYELAIISYLQKDFRTLRKWIVFLTDLEFDSRSYQNIPSHHSFQIVANNYFLGLSVSCCDDEDDDDNFLFSDHVKKFSTLKESIHIRTHKEHKKSGDIILIGGDEILPWAFRRIKIRDKTFEVLPLYCRGIKCSDLQNGNVVTDDLKKRRSLLDRLDHLVRSKFCSNENPSIVLFMMGELDLRCRVLNLPPSDTLHYTFCESFQIELLAEILLRFSYNCAQKFDLPSVYILPVFHSLFSTVEKVRVLREKSKSLEEVCCENRIDIFNRALRKRCENSQDFGKYVKYLDGFDEETRLKKDDEMKEIELGYGTCVVPNCRLLRKLGSNLEEKM